MSELYHESVQSVDRAFECPECGSVMGVPNSNTPVYYCPKYKCDYEKKLPQMTVEQRFYAKVAQKCDKPAKKEVVKEWLKDASPEVTE